MKTPRGLWAALAATALAVLYLVLIGRLAFALISSGELIGVVIGLCALVGPVLTVYVMAFEWRLAVQVQKMARELAALETAPSEPLPRLPSGRVTPEAAQIQFEHARAQVEASPQDWRAWFALGFAYNDSRDRKRGRAALRQAARLYSNP